MKWFTCTPVDFGGGEDFFSRDSGLLSRGFRSLGVESMAVMPGESRSDDRPDLQRTNDANLRSADWWRQHRLDGVVLYAWGSGRHLGVARAIKEAGVHLVSSIDSSGLLSPHAHFRDYAQLNASKQIAERGRLVGCLRGAALIVRNLVPGLLDLPRLKHLEQADAVTMVTPEAVRIMKELALRFGYPGVAEKTVHLPHPQLELFDYRGTAKEKMVLSVGRWETDAWFQKNPQLLIESLGRFLTRREDYQSLIVGQGCERLQAMIGDLDPAVAGRIELMPHVSPATLRELYNRAQIACWSSRHEGQQNTGAQALCCGASVVGTTGMAVNCFEYYASRSSGRQATSNTAGALAEALVLEAEAWDSGRRSGAEISRSWCPEFHAGKVAQRVLDLMND